MVSHPLPGGRARVAPVVSTPGSIRGQRPGQLHALEGRGQYRVYPAVMCVATADPKAHAVAVHYMS
jgi:hypothetical protein